MSKKFLPEYHREGERTEPCDTPEFNYYTLICPTIDGNRKGNIAVIIERVNRS